MMFHAARLPLLIVLTTLVAMPVQARDRSADDGASDRRERREDAGARVRQVERDGGRVLRAEPMQQGGREVYRIKVLTPEGRVRVMRDDGDRGRSDRGRSERDSRPAPPPRAPEPEPARPRGEPEGRNNP